ncbi:hypothetical protein ACHAO7_011886 [Fusarium culmorum]
MDAPPTNGSTQTLDKSIQYLIQHLKTCSALAQENTDWPTFDDKLQLPLASALLCVLLTGTELLNARVVDDNQDAPPTPYTQRGHYVMQVRRFYHVRCLRDLSVAEWPIDAAEQEQLIVTHFVESIHGQLREIVDVLDAYTTESIFPLQ